MSGISGTSTITGADIANAYGPVIWGIYSKWVLIWSLISAESIKGVYIIESICSSDFTVWDEDICCDYVYPLVAWVLPAAWFWF